MPDHQPVDLAMTIPSEQDGNIFEKLFDLGDSLLKPLLPEKQLDVIEQIIFNNWMMARGADARIACAVEHVRRFELWRHRKIQNEQGETVREFENFGAWSRWIYSHFSGLSQRAIDYRQAGVRIAQSLGFDFGETVDLLADPNAIHQIARLFETSNLSEFEGFVSPGVKQRFQEMVGDTDGEFGDQELAKVGTSMILNSDGSVAGKVDALLHTGEVRHKWEWNGKHLQFVVYVVGHPRERTVVKFVAEGKIPAIALEHLGKYGRK